MRAFEIRRWKQGLLVLKGAAEPLAGIALFPTLKTWLKTFELDEKLLRAFVDIGADNVADALIVPESFLESCGLTMYEKEQWHKAQSSMSSVSKASTANFPKRPGLSPHHCSLHSWVQRYNSGLFFMIK
jgi:hypothetical protein